MCGWLSVCVCVCGCVSVCLAVCQNVCLSVSFSVSPVSASSLCLSVHLFVSLSICMCVVSVWLCFRGCHCFCNPFSLMSVGHYSRTLLIVAGSCSFRGESKTRLQPADRQTAPCTLWYMREFHCSRFFAPAGATCSHPASHIVALAAVGALQTALMDDQQCKHLLLRTYIVTGSHVKDNELGFDPAIRGLKGRLTTQLTLGACLLKMCTQVSFCPFLSLLCSVLHFAC